MKEIDNIPKNSKISIYGAGEVGRFVKRYICENRPDLKVVCFFDKIIRDDIDGIKVHYIKDIEEFSDSFDTVIVASFSNTSVMETILKYYGVKNYFHIENIEQFFIQVAPDDFEKIKQVQDILNSKESKEIFELIVKAYNCKICLMNLIDYLKKKGSNLDHEQYLDFINPDIIKTVISAGAYDAGTSLLFLDRLKNIEKIYAFEPMYEKFKCEVNDSIIRESGKVEIIQKGLFDKSEEITFHENSCASRVDTISPQTTGLVIPTVSIDDFVKENNINKIDFIKMDVEGCELKALKGAEKTIRTHRPQMAICIYHSYEELFDIPLYMANTLQDYKFEVYHYSLTHARESVLYAIPNEVNQ